MCGVPHPPPRAGARRPVGIGELVPTQESALVATSCWNKVCVSDQGSGAFRQDMSMKKKKKRYVHETGVG